MSCIFSYHGLVYCRKIYEKGLKHAKDSSLSNDWTSRFLQGLSINQCWCASSHPDWRSYEGSGNHNTSYFLLSISTLHTNLCWNTERSFMNLVLLYNKCNLKRKFVSCIYSLFNDTTVAELQWLYSTKWQDDCTWVKKHGTSWPWNCCVQIINECDSMAPLLYKLPTVTMQTVRIMLHLHSRFGSSRKPTYSNRARFIWMACWVSRFPAWLDVSKRTTGSGL